MTCKCHDFLFIPLGLTIQLSPNLVGFNAMSSWLQYICIWAPKVSSLFTHVVSFYFSHTKRDRGLRPQIETNDIVDSFDDKKSKFIIEKRPLNVKIFSFSKWNKRRVITNMKKSLARLCITIQFKNQLKVRSPENHWRSSWRPSQISLNYRSFANGRTCVIIEIVKALPLIKKILIEILSS